MDFDIWTADGDLIVLVYIWTKGTLTLMDTSVIRMIDILIFIIILSGGTPTATVVL